jgi:diguanylate cyclase (GGDEF)-like protein
MNALFPLRFRDAALFTAVTLAIGNAINIVGAYAHHVAIARLETVVVCHVLTALSLLVRFLAEWESRHGFVLGLRLRIRADDLARSNVKLQEMSNTDPLTGLANRRYFDQALTRAWQSAVGSWNSVAVLMIDVDHFKTFNDIAGHLEGDRCLTTVARTIAEQVRQDSDLAARFGGEEFVVLMPKACHADAYKAAERIHTAISALRVFHPGRIGRGFVSVSIGVATMIPSGPDASPTDLLRQADAAMYEAKAAGRDRVMGDRRSEVAAGAASRQQF